MSNIESIGRIAVALQCPVARVRSVASQLGIEPAMRINGIDHYGDNAIEQIAHHVRSQHARDAALGGGGMLPGRNVMF